MTDPAVPALVEIDDVSKSFGDKTALTGVTFHVPAGQICGVLGPNGAGKSPGGTRLLAGAVVAVGAGLALGVFGEAYLQLLEQLARSGFLPALPEREGGASRVWLAVATVGLAALGEEYLFRGMLFKSLQREWGVGAAVLGSACFFAVYHPPLAWLPVGLVGAACALLFRRSGHLAPSVLLHMVYNGVVVLML